MRLSLDVYSELFLEFVNTFRGMAHLLNNQGPDDIEVNVLRNTAFTLAWSVRCERGGYCRVVDIFLNKIAALGEVNCQFCVADEELASNVGEIVMLDEAFLINPGNGPDIPRIAQLMARTVFKNFNTGAVPTQGELSHLIEQLHQHQSNQ